MQLIDLEVLVAAGVLAGVEATAAEAAVAATATQENNNHLREDTSEEKSDPALYKSR